MIPMIELRAVINALGDRLQSRLDQVLEGGRFILGPEVAELEDRLVSFSGAACAVGVASGTDALKIAMMSRGVGPGDAIFVPALSFVATAGAVVALGATPIFVDVGWDDMTLDPRDLKERIRAVRAEGSLRPAALVPVDLFGLPARYEELIPLAAAEGLTLIADAAQAFGAKVKDCAVGALAPVTTLSFYPTKPLGCFGDGGAVLSLDSRDAVAFRELRQHGLDETHGEARRIGLNSRLDTLQAAVLLARLERFEAELRWRETVAGWYDELLGDAVETPKIPPGRKSAWAIYSIRSPQREKIRECLREAEIETRIYYSRPICDHPAYTDYRRWAGGLPNCRRICEQVLALPIHPYLSRRDTERISGVVVAAVRRSSKPSL